MRPLLIALLGAALALACGGDAPASGPEPVQPRIVSVRHSEPVIVGTSMVVTAANGDVFAAAPRLRLTADELYELEPSDPGADSADSAWSYPVSQSVYDTLGLGTHPMTVALVGETASGARVESPEYPLTFTIAYEVAPFVLSDVPSGSVFRNEPSVLAGDGFLESEEGSVLAHFEGTFTPEGGSPTPIDVRLPVTQAEPGNRARGLVRLGTELGGALPGEYVGTVRLESEVPNRDPQSTEALATTLRFQPPAVLAIEPEAAPLEHLVFIRGGGFLGGSADELTLIRLSGSFSDASGASRSIAQELVPEWRSGETLAWVLDSEVSDGVLTSPVFGSGEGRFVGEVTPVTLFEGAELEGSAAPIDLELSPVEQVVWLRFVPGFYDSLPRFGLGAAAGTIEAMVAERIEGIFGAWRVEVRTSQPEDVAPAGYATVEIGGPDPNGLGLFGYDNTPGKDVGNLRLFDAIGGANAETQEDGYPGYGGVFVESMLMWSEHPDIPGDLGADPDPLFDAIFDPVRETPATAGEVAGGGRPEVARALEALAAVIGETAAHELGHSFGLAEPYGSATTFHNPGDEAGCLMDSGANRPFGERAAQPGFAATRLCGDSATYLDAILGG